MMPHQPDPSRPPADPSHSGSADSVRTTERTGAGLVGSPPEQQSDHGSASGAVPLGTLAGRYAVERRLGQGATSTAFLALDTALQRQVTLKFLRRDMLDHAEVRTRFEAEAQTAAALADPRIVQVFDSGMAPLPDDPRGPELPYIVLEYAPGADLTHRIAEGPGRLDDVLPLIDDLLGALEFAHGQGRVHGDVKPSNVFESGASSVKLTDFGLSEGTTTPAKGQAPSGMMGTAAYLSPEQVQGGPATPQSDVYSAGVVVFQLLTGRTPFVGSSESALAEAKTKRAAPSLGSLLPDLPGHVIAAVDRALAVKPSRRFSSAADFRRALHGEKVSARRGLAPLSSPAPAIDPSEHPVTGHRSLPVEDAPGDGAAAPVPPAPGLSDIRPETSQLDNPEFSSPELDGPRPEAARPAEDRTGSLSTLIAESQRHESQEKIRTQSGVSQPSRRTVNRRLAFGLIALSSGAILTGGYVLVRKILPGGPDGSDRTVTVPELRNSTKEAAGTRLDQLGLRHTFEERNSQDVPRGLVVETSPKASTAVDHNDSVTVVLSSGPERSKIPSSILGATEEQAKKVLDELNLTVGEVNLEDSAQAEPGKIFGVSPAVGQEVPAGTAVILTVASGKLPIPLLVGLSEKEATERLGTSAPGIRVETSRSLGTGRPAGTVASQSVPAGTSLERGDVLRLVISADAPRPTAPPSPSNPPMPTTKPTSAPTQPPSSQKPPIKPTGRSTPPPKR